ncbi:helix-turn-helix domain-containing protein [Yinghuangia aomiensis]
MPPPRSPNARRACGGRTARSCATGADGEPLPSVRGNFPATALAAGPGGVWLERPDGPGPLDSLVLERMALAAVTAAHTNRPGPQPADPALVELVLADGTPAEGRVRALRLLGLVPGRPLAVVAVRGAVPGRPRRPARRNAGLRTRWWKAWSRSSCGRRRHRTRSWARRCRPASWSASGTRWTPSGPRTSWAQARVALRFAVAGDAEAAVVRHDGLGALAVLAALPPEELRRRPELAAVEAYAARPGGEGDLAAVEAFCRSGSLRGAAAHLHLHHSSVADRVARAGRALGWELPEPADRFRAMLALTLRRLSRD